MRRKLKIWLLRWLLKGCWANEWEDPTDHQVMIYLTLDESEESRRRYTEHSRGEGFWVGEPREVVGPLELPNFKVK